MTQEHEEKIRRRAYEIWEREGRPNGRDRDHWHEAKHELENEESASRTNLEVLKASREPSGPLASGAEEQPQARSDEAPPPELVDIVGELKQTLETIVEAIGGDRDSAGQEIHEEQISEPAAARQVDDDQTGEASVRRTEVRRTNTLEAPHSRI
jgi:hypothetical protein